VRNQYTDMYKALSLTDRRHDLIVVRLSDPREYSLPNLGILTLEDAETGQLIELDTGNSRVRAAYEGQNTKQLEDFKQTLKRLGIDGIYVDNGQPYITKIREFFLTREKRR
jgi:uncharacterized protein (DUF58 family)